MFANILKKAGEKVFEELMKEKINNFETRIKELEREVELLKSYTKDMKLDMRDVQNELKQINKVTSKMEGSILTVLMLRGQQNKKLDDGND